MSVDYDVGTVTTTVTACGTDENRGLCHWLTPDGLGSLCGLRFTDPSRGHVPQDPAADPCDCGFPRCRKCDALKRDRP